MLKIWEDTGKRNIVYLELNSSTSYCNERQNWITYKKIRVREVRKNGLAKASIMQPVWLQGVVAGQRKSEKWLSSSQMQLCS